MAERHKNTFLLKIYGENKILEDVLKILLQYLWKRKLGDVSECGRVRNSENYPFKDKTENDKDCQNQLFRTLEIN